MESNALMYQHNASQRTPCMLVLDASGSMATMIQGGPQTRIGELNRGLVMLRDELCADDTAAMRVQISVVCVGGDRGDAELLMDWTDANRFEPPILRAGGPTPLAHGMRLALHHVEEHKSTLRRNGIFFTRPWIMVISDGEPSDSRAEWEGVAEECKLAESRKRCMIFPIGVEDANLLVLQELSTTPAAKLSGMKFREYFKWLSASLSAVSRATTGDSVVLPATNPWAVFK